MMERHHAFGLGVLATATVAGLALWIAPSRRIAPEPKQLVAERLPDVARAAMRTQMHAHGGGMLELTSEVTQLQYDDAAATAQRILAEPRMARPLGNDASELNAQLPERFFALQDELHDRVQAIARAARAHDPDGSAEAMGETMRTCVHCHDAYLRGR
jgi:hypothetical protein